MSQEWSRVVSAEVKEEYMTLQGIQTHCSQLTSQNTKFVKSNLSLTLMRVKLVNFGFIFSSQQNLFVVAIKKCERLSNLSFVKPSFVTLVSFLPRFNFYQRSKVNHELQAIIVNILGKK